MIKPKNGYTDLANFDLEKIVEAPMEFAWSASSI